MSNKQIDTFKGAARQVEVDDESRFDAALKRIAKATKGNTPSPHPPKPKSKMAGFED